MLVLSGVLFLLIAGSVAAADEIAPLVDVPDDLPGADEVAFPGEIHDFDASGSTDDTGIVAYKFTFMDGDTPVTLNSATGTAQYTFVSYGPVWVTVQAWDAAGNMGIAYYAIDVAEKITSDLVMADGTFYVDHSLYLIDSDLLIDNAEVDFSEGAGGLVAEGEGAPDMFGESLTPEGDMAGHWEPYNYNSYWKNGNSQYGRPSFDTSTKFSGEGSIKISGGTYAQGWEYHFNEKQDLTEFDTLTFWRHSDRNSDVNYMYYIYFYGDWSTSSTFGYINTMSGVYQQGGYSVYHGWYAHTVSLDLGTTGRISSYNMADLSNVAVVRFYTQNIGSGYSMWIDHIGFDNTEYKDDITESTSPGGDMAGYWSGFSGISSNSLVGSYSLYRYLYSGSTYSFAYNFYNPQDLSMMDGLRFYIDSTRTYWYYWDAWHMWVNDAYGHTAYFQNKWSQYFYYGNGAWFGMSMPWGDGPASISTNFDWTAVTRVTLGNFRVTSYSASIYIDAWEWYEASDRVVMTEDVIPTTIYVDGGDTTITGGSTVRGTGAEIGARIMTDGGTTTIQNAHFDNVWHTEAPSAGNGLEVFGGIEAYGDATIDHVSFSNCLGPGLALFDGTWTLDKTTINLAGTALKVKTSPRIIMGVTDRSTGNINIDISGWTLEDGIGTGILFMAKDTSASVTLDIHGNNVDNNGFAGIVVSNCGGLYTSPFMAGGTADMDVIIRDQVIEGSGDYGILYYAGGGDWAPNVRGSLTVDNVTVRNSGESGMLVWLDAGYTNFDGMYTNSLFEKNSGAGIEHEFGGFFGDADIEMHNVTSQDNDGNGLDIVSYMQPYSDGTGNIISPVANVDILINASFLRENSGWGVSENLNAMESPDGGMAPPWTWSGPTRTTLWYNVTMTYSAVSANAAGGWMSYPKDGWSHADEVASRDIIDCTFNDNRGSALYIQPNHDMWGGGGMISDVYMMTDTVIVDNGGGVEENLAYDNPGYYSELHLTGCRIEDNDGYSIETYGDWAWDGINRWGLSRVRGAMVYVDDCRLNSPAYIMLEGADDSGGSDWVSIMGVQFTNNVIDVEDEEVFFILGAYPDCRMMTAWAEIGHNRFLRGFIDDGIDLMMYGGMDLNMDVLIFDQEFDRPVSSGLNLVAGTLTGSNADHQIYGKVMIDNVTVTDAGANGINFTVIHRQVVGAKNRGILEMNDVMMDGVTIGIIANDLTGRIYDTTITNTMGQAVDISYSTFDFYSCDVGPVNTANIKVLTKGAARMWFDVDVAVRWAGGVVVNGAVVSLSDNTWATIGVDTVTNDEAVRMGYVNSYTILPDSTYSKSPFLVSATYLGLETEQSIDIDSDRVIDLVLVDNVLPRLTVNEPLEGTKQTETTLFVKGYAWDMHSGMDMVLVSIDDFNWFEAVGNPDFEYTFMDVPEGNLILRVKAIDFAGNERMAFRAVLIDATPPAIIIIEPKNDVFSTNVPILDVIGVTEVGAIVMVDNDPLTLDHTLFSTTVTLREGNNEIRVVALDRLGNRAVHVIYVELDTIAPPLVVTSPAADSVVGKDSVTVTGQTEDGAMVYIDGELVANLDGLFTATVELSEGPNAIIVMAKDMVGNSRTTIVPVTMDTRMPWLQLASPMEGDVFGPGGIEVRGWVEGGSIVQINNLQVEVVDGFFSTSIIGSEGTNTIFVTVVDQAGNTNSMPVSVWFDTIAPTIKLDSPDDGTTTNEGTVEVSGQLIWDDREGFRDISLLINGEFAPFSATGEFRVQYDLVEGTNPMTIKALDDVGNSNSETVIVVMDSKAPFLLAEATPTFNHPVWNKAATYNSLVYIDGTTEPGAMVTVDGSVVIVGADGTFNVSILLNSVPKDQDLVQRSVVIIARDLAGNSVEETIDVYRLKQEETSPGFGDYDTAQYWVLFLSIVILAVAVIAAAFLWRRVGMQPDEEYDDMYQEEV